LVTSLPGLLVADKLLLASLDTVLPFYNRKKQEILSKVKKRLRNAFEPTMPPIYTLLEVDG
jgi:hypothetical protein